MLQTHVSTVPVSEHEVAVDLSQCISRLAYCKIAGAVGCQTPQHKQFLRKQWRPLCGFESMALNGFHPALFARFAFDGSFSDADFKKLGGEAFNGGCAQAALTIAVAVFEFPSSHRELDELRLAAKEIQRQRASAVAARSPSVIGTVSEARSWTEESYSIRSSSGSSRSAVEAHGEMRSGTDSQSHGSPRRDSSTCSRDSRSHSR